MLYSLNSNKEENTNVTFNMLTFVIQKRKSWVYAIVQC